MQSVGIIPQYDLIQENALLLAKQGEFHKKPSIDWNSSKFIVEFVNIKS